MDSQNNSVWTGALQVSGSTFCSEQVSLQSQTSCSRFYLLSSFEYLQGPRFHDLSGHLSQCLITRNLLSSYKVGNSSAEICVCCFLPLYCPLIRRVGHPFYSGRKCREPFLAFFRLKNPTSSLQSLPAVVLVDISLKDKLPPQGEPAQSCSQATLSVVTVPEGVRYSMGQTR